MQAPTPENMSAIALFRHVFGFKPNQTLSEFVAECKDLKNDDQFVREVRNYAIAQSAVV